MARRVPWPDYEAEVGIRAVWHGRTITQSPVSGREHLIDRSALRWAGTLAFDVTDDKEHAQQIEQMMDLLVEPDAYTRLPTQRSAGFFAGVDPGTGNTGGEVTVKALIGQNDGLYVLLSPVSSTQQKDAVDGKFATDPKVGDYFQQGERLYRVGGVKYGAVGATSLAAAATPAASRPAILVEPSVVSDWPDDAELTPPEYVRARFSKAPRPSSFRGNGLYGPWAFEWTEYIPEPESQAAPFTVLEEIRPFSVPVGGIAPINTDRLWHYDRAAGFSIHASSDSDRVSFPPIAGAVQNVRGRRIGLATVTLELRSPEGDVLDTQSTTVTVRAKDANIPPRIISPVSKMTLRVGETKYVNMLGIAADADDDVLDYQPESSNGAVASAKRFGDRIAVTGNSVGPATISVLIVDSSNTARLIRWDVDVMSVGDPDAITPGPQPLLRLKGSASGGQPDGAQARAPRMSGR